MPVRVELISWVAIALLLSAYVAVSLGWLTSGSLVFQLLNAVGSAGMIWYGFLRKAWAIVAFNFFWALIALFALFKLV